MRTIRVQGQDLDIDDDRPMRLVRSPGEALSWHLDMHRWALGDQSLGVFQTLSRVASGGEYEDEAMSAARAALLGSMLDAGQTMFVSADMGRLIDGIASTWREPGSVPTLEITDVPSDAGLVVFEEPVEWDVPLGGDIEGEDDISPFTVIRGFAWRLFPKGGTVSVRVPGRKDPVDLYLFPDKDPESAMAAALESGGIIVYPLLDGTTYLGTESEHRALGRPPGVPMSVIAIPFGHDFDIAANVNPLSSFHMTHRTVTALFRLIWQRVLPLDVADIDRAGRRRWGRQMSGEINVVHLRRYVPRSRKGQPAYEGPGLAWTVAVRGHWRWQHYATLGPAYTPDDDGDEQWNPTSHRKIWIDPHYRGDGPLAEERHKVSAVVR